MGGEDGGRKENKLLGTVRFVRHREDENPLLLPKKDLKEGC